MTLALVVSACFLAGALTAAGHDPVTLGGGLIEGPADGTTVVSVQGFHFQGEDNKKKPARLVAADPTGSVEWMYESRPETKWFYDVDPLADGTLLVTATNESGTTVFEFDPETDTRVWAEFLPIRDTHDVDLLENGNLVVANMREYADGVSDDRVFVYNRTTEQITWEWTFREHFSNDTDGGFGEDWTHVNDVDPVGDDAFLVSPRNFDQVLLIDRETKEITARLGDDGDHETLFEQHNPDVVATDPLTILVADSENDRVVEYARIDGEWQRTWAVTGFHWPRDADRLPNGNTLVTDTLAHRVVEVTPAGEVVWEFAAPWAPYDAERLGTGDGSNGPTMRAHGTTGTVEVNGTTTDGPAGTTTPADVIGATGDGTPLAEFTSWLARVWAHVTPWLRPVWLSRWAFAAFALGGTVACCWGAGELLVRRRAVLGRIGTAFERVRERL